MADEAGPFLRRPGRILSATRWSLQGLAACWRLESSFRLECVLFAVLAPVALWLGETAVEQVLLVSSMVAVLAMEVVNSALEALADRFGGEHNEYIGRAKDMGSAAVFLCMLNVVLVWALLLGPRWWG